MNATPKKKKKKKRKEEKDKKIERIRKQVIVSQKERAENKITNNK